MNRESSQGIRAFCGCPGRQSHLLRPCTWNHRLPPEGGHAPAAHDSCCAYGRIESNKELQNLQVQHKGEAPWRVPGGGGGAGGRGWGEARDAETSFCGTLLLPLKLNSFSHLHLFSLLGLVNTSSKTQKKGGGQKWVAKFGALMVSILDLAVPTMNLTTLGL